jgi:hypothetical protein
MGKEEKKKNSANQHGLKGFQDFAGKFSANASQGENSRCTRECEEGYVYKLHAGTKEARCL